MNKLKALYLLVMMIIITSCNSFANKPMKHSGIDMKWENVNPGAGGQVQDIIPDPTKEGRLFFLSDMEGVYRSDDNGLTWQYKSVELYHPTAYALAVDPHDSNRVYVSGLYGIHYSDNGGDNWSKMTSFPDDAIATLTVNPIDSNILYAGPGWTEDDSFVSNSKKDNDPSLHRFIYIYPKTKE